MAVNLSYGNFPLLPEVSINENTRPGTIILEYFQVAVTLSTQEGDVEVPTALGSVIGVIPLSYSSSFGAGELVKSPTTDGVITNGAVTVRYTAAVIGDVDVTVRGFLVGTKAATTLLNS